MCGRYSLISPVESVARLFGLDCRPNLPPRYNIAPNQEVPVVRDRGGGRTLDYMRWGLVPPWAKDAAIGQRMINARAETVMEKPSFRNAFKLRRCLIPADGFYEWQVRTKGPKQPYRICREDGAPFAFAGLWETWGDGGGDELLTCTIVTTEANRSLGEIHQRMPVILGEGDFSVWLDTTYDDSQALHKMLMPAVEELLVAYRISMLVNNVRNDHSDCIAPLSTLP